LQTTWQKIRKWAKIEDVRIHDLRHTFASNATEAGQVAAVIFLRVMIGTPVIYDEKQKIRVSLITRTTSPLLRIPSPTSSFSPPLKKRCF